MGLAALPLLAAGLGLLVTSQPGRVRVAAIVAVAVVTTLALQTLAGLRLARTALPKPQANRLLAVLVVRVLLLLVMVLGTQVYLVSGALKQEYLGGDYGPAAGASGGVVYWLSMILPQAAIALPAVAADILLARAAMRTARSVSDDRPAWKALNSLLNTTCWLMALAGLLTIIPFAGWVLGPILLLVCDSMMFASIARAAGLHLSELNGRSTQAR